MPNPNDLDVTSYAGAPRIPAQSAKPLARLLRNQAPADLDDLEREQLGALERLAGELDAALKQRESLGGVRASLLDFVNAWSNSHAALEAMGRLPRAYSRNAERAARTLAVVFPEGAGFTRLTASQAWAAGDRTLARLREADLEAEVDALIGPEFLATARQATIALGDTLGMGATPVEIPNPTAVADLLARFQRSVGRYGRVVAARVDEEDPASVERFRRTIAAPIDRYRSTRLGREDAEPSAPEGPMEPVIEPGSPSVPEAPRPPA